MSPSETAKFMPTAPPIEEYTGANEKGLVEAYPVTDSSAVSVVAEPFFEGAAGAPPEGRERVLSAKHWEALRQAKKEQLHPRWFDLEKNRHLTYQIAAVSAVGFTAMALLVGLGITPYAAPAAFVLRRTAIATACAFASALTACFLYPRDHSFDRDPDYWIHLGQAIEREVNKEEPPACRSFNQKFKKLAADAIVGKAFFNALYQPKISDDQLSYSELKEWLSSEGGARGLFGFDLDQANRKHLKAKAQSAVSQGVSLSKREIAVLGFSAQEISRIRALKTCQTFTEGKGSLEGFCQNIGSDWRELTSEEIRGLRPLVLKKLVESEKGVQQILNQMQEMERRGIDFSLSEEDISRPVVDRQYDRLKRGVIDFGQFQELIGDRLGLIDPDNRSQLSSCAFAYFAKGDAGLAKALSLRDQNLVEFTMEALIEAGALRPSLEALRDKRVGYQAFRDKHSLSAIAAHQKSPNVSEEDKKLLRQAFCASYFNMRAYSQDAPSLGISNLSLLLEAQLEQELNEMTEIGQVASLGRSAIEEGKITKSTPKIRQMTAQFFAAKGYGADFPLDKKLIADEIQTRIDQASQTSQTIEQEYEAHLRLLDLQEAQQLTQLEAGQREQLAGLNPLKDSIESYQREISQKEGERIRLASCQAAEKRRRETVAANKAALSRAEKRYEELQAEEVRVGSVIPELKESLIRKKSALEAERASLSEKESLLNAIGQIPYLENKLQELQRKIEAAQAGSLEKSQEEVKGVLAAWEVQAAKNSFDQKARALEGEKEQLERSLDQAKRHLHQKETLEKEVKESKSRLKELPDIERRLALATKRCDIGKQQQDVKKEIERLKGSIAEKDSHWLLSGISEVSSGLALNSIDSQIQALRQSLNEAQRSYDHQKNQISLNFSQKKSGIQLGFHQQKESALTEKNARLQNTRASFRLAVQKIADEPWETR